MISRVFSALLILAAIAPTVAQACEIKDIRAWLAQDKDLVGSFCQDHGNAISSIVASDGLAVTPADSSNQGYYAVKCINGDILIGKVSLDSATCLFKDMRMIPTTKNVWPNP